MDDSLVDSVVDFEISLSVVVHDFVGLCLWIHGDQGPIVGHVEFLLREFGIFWHFVGFIVVLLIDLFYLVGMGAAHELWFFDVLFLN